MKKETASKTKIQTQIKPVMQRGIGLPLFDKHWSKLTAAEMKYVGKTRRYRSDLYRYFIW